MSLIPFLIFIAVLLIYPAVQRKIQVRLWHLWNGDTTEFQAYVIPVPMGWVARHERETVGLLEVGTYLTRDEFGSMIVFSKGQTPKNMGLASSLNEQSVLSQGAQILDRQTIEFDAEKADCIVSNALTKGLPVPNDIVAITCESTADLSIRFNGSKGNVDTFLSVVSQIRKHNGGQN